MGCASSAVLPFRGGGGGGGEISENKGLGGMMMRMNQGFSQQNLTDKINDSVHSKPVQNVIESVTHVKDDIFHHVQDAGNTAANKVSMVVQDIENNIESALGQVKKGADDLKESVNIGDKQKALEEAAENLSEAPEKMLENVNDTIDEESENVADAVTETVDEGEKTVEQSVKAAEESLGGEIDDLLASLPDDNDAPKSEVKHS